MDPFTRQGLSSFSGRALLRALFFFVVSYALVVVDTIVLATRPSVLRGYLRGVAHQWTHSPYADLGFERVNAARRVGQSVVELTYGETPTCVARQILKRAGVRKNDLVVDIGCGRGRVLFAALSLGARARGVDILRPHILALRASVRGLDATVEEKDALQCDVGDADVVFLTWTCMSDRTRERMAAHLLTMQPGARAVLVNHPLDADGFRLVSSFRALFSWGLAPVYVVERVMRDPTSKDTAASAPPVSR